MRGKSFPLFLVVLLTLGWLPSKFSHGLGEFDAIINQDKNLTLEEKRWHLQYTGTVDKVARISVLRNLTNNVNVRESHEEIYQDVSMDSSWVTNIPLLPIIFATSEYLPEGQCKNQVRRYMRDLKNGTLWATRMFDSSTKIPEGILSGHTRHFGDFDGCYNLHVDLPYDGESSDEPQEIDGKYCLVRLDYRKLDLPPPTKSIHNFDFDPHYTAWEAIREKGDFRRVKRYLMQMALCVPSACTAEDVEKALQWPVKEEGSKYNVKIDVSVRPRLCQTRKDEPEFSTAGKIFSYVVLSLFLLVIISTWYDSSLPEGYVEENSKTRDLLLCFSAKRNFQSIMKVNYNHPGLDTMHLMKFFSMCCVIIGHRTMQYFYNPMVNAEYMERSYALPSSMMVYNGTIIVDGFFAMGGLLVAYGLLEHLDKKKRINYPALIFIRFLRLTPAYMFIVFFHMYILPYWGSGPYWNARVGLERDNCANNWWTNLFYINNYVNPKNMCMFQSWYLTVDFHLYIGALFVIYTFWRLPRNIGYAFLGALIIASGVMPFVTSYAYGVPPIFRGLPHLQEIREDSYFLNYYIKSHLRITAYLVGVVSGVFIYDYKKATWRLPKTWSRGLFILFAVVMTIMSEFLGYKYYDPNLNPSPLDSALYATLHRGAFALGYCSVIVLVTIGDGLDFHLNFLTPGWAQPLGRLTYGAFLVHTVNQIYDIGVARTARTVTIHNAFWDFVPDVIYTFFLSLLLSLGIEGPFRRIEQRFFSKRESNIQTERITTSSKTKVN